MLSEAIKGGLIIAAIITIVAGVNHVLHSAEQRGFDRASAQATIREQAQLLDYQQRLNAALAKAAKEKNALLSDQQERVNVAQKIASQRGADLGRAVAARDSVQHALTEYLAAATRGIPGDPSAAPGGQCAPVAAAAGVSAKLYGESDRLAGIFAAQADAAFDAGQQCERAYDEVVKELQ